LNERPSSGDIHGNDDHLPFDFDIGSFVNPTIGLRLRLL